MHFVAGMLTRHVSLDLAPSNILSRHDDHWA